MQANLDVVAQYRATCRSITELVASREESLTPLRLLSQEKRQELLQKLVSEHTHIIRIPDNVDLSLYLDDDTADVPDSDVQSILSGSTDSMLNSRRKRYLRIGDKIGNHSINEVTISEIFARMQENEDDTHTTGFDLVVSRIVKLCQTNAYGGDGDDGPPRKKASKHKEAQQAFVVEGDVHEVNINTIDLFMQVFAEISRSILKPVKPNENMYLDKCKMRGCPLTDLELDELCTEEILDMFLAWMDAASDYKTTQQEYAARLKRLETRRDDLKEKIIYMAPDAILESIDDLAETDDASFMLSPDLKVVLRKFVHRTSIPLSNKDFAAKVKDQMNVLMGDTKVLRLAPSASVEAIWAAVRGIGWNALMAEAEKYLIAWNNTCRMVDEQEERKIELKGI